MTMVLHPHLQSLAWALLHFLWQGLLLWLIAASVFHLTARRRPQVRYTLGLCFMALALALPACTWWMLHAGASPAPLPGPESLSHTDVALALASPTRVTSWRWHPVVSQALPWCLVGWALGATFFTLRLTGGWWWLQRLKGRMEPLEAHWHAHLLRVAQCMGLSRRIRAGVSKEITTPLVIGWIRPVLLIPASLLTGLDPLSLEVLLAHEVAHLKRYDVLFNWMQCAVEVVLFYHPAVWWLSRRTRLERECCCDDAAVAFCGDPLRYAETLNRLDDLQSLSFSTAQAANGANLMYRITRLLSPNARAPRFSLLLPSLALLAAGALTLSASSPTPHQAPASPAPHAKPASPTTKSAPKAEPKPIRNAEEKQAEQKVDHRSISFSLWSSKEGGPRLNLNVNRATRAEVEAALARIEGLITPNTDRGDRNFPIEGVWSLKPYKDSPDDLLNFNLKQVTPEEARKLF
jgi:beta-lactamase regulating signal transducer with metallopeptidase domain